MTTPRGAVTKSQINTLRALGVLICGLIATVYAVGREEVAVVREHCDERVRAARVDLLEYMDEMRSDQDKMEVRLEDCQSRLEGCLRSSARPSETATDSYLQ